MSLGTKRAAVVLGAVLVSLTGCGSDDAESGGGSSSSGPGGSSSTSPSASPSSSASASGDGEAAKKEAKTRARAATRKALLPSKAFTKIGLEVADEPETKRWDWFDTCTPSLPSEIRQVLGTHGRWEGDGSVVSQTVTAYPDGVAADIVGEVGKAVDCTSFTSNNIEFTKVAQVDLPTPAGADAGVAWCQLDAESGVHLCHSVVAAQDLVSALWVADADRAEARAAMTTLTKLATARIQAQVS